MYSLIRPPRTGFGGSAVRRRRSRWRGERHVRRRERPGGPRLRTPCRREPPAGVRTLRFPRLSPGRSSRPRSDAAPKSPKPRRLIPARSPSPARDPGVPLPQTSVRASSAVDAAAARQPPPRTPPHHYQPGRDVPPGVPGAIFRHSSCRDPADPGGPRIVCATARQPVRRAVPAGQGRRAAGAAAWLLHLEDRGHHRAAGRRLDRIRRGGQLVVADRGGRVPGGDLHPDRVPGPRRRAPADLRHPAGQLRRRGPARQPGHRAELRLVGRQAQPPSRAPQHRGRGPRHRGRRAGVHRRPGARQPAALPGWCSATRRTCSSRCCCWKGSTCTSRASGR